MHINITLTIRSIANGFLIDPDTYKTATLSDGGPGAVFYATFDEACDALAAHAREAKARAAVEMDYRYGDHRAGLIAEKRDEIVQFAGVDFSKQQVTQPKRGFTIGAGIIERFDDLPTIEPHTSGIDHAKLPEERAASAVESNTFNEDGDRG